MNSPDFERLWSDNKHLFTENRRQRIEQTLQNRMAHLSVILQDVHQPHNISACLRSADAFGIQNCHIIDAHQKFKPSTVARGVNHWLSIHKYKSISDCIDSVKNQGYKIAGAYPCQEALPLAEIPVDKPLAVVFGNEHEGVDSDFLPFLDYKFSIPMYGMVESLNISVSCAITLEHLSGKIRNIIPAQKRSLSSIEKMSLLTKWIERHTRRRNG